MQEISEVFGRNEAEIKHPVTVSVEVRSEFDRHVGSREVAHLSGKPSSHKKNAKIFKVLAFNWGGVYRIVPPIRCRCLIVSIAMPYVTPKVTP